MGKEGESILRDELVVTLHESTDDSLSVQEGETGKTEKIARRAGTRRKLSGNRFH